MIFFLLLLSTTLLWMVRRFFIFNSVLFIIIFVFIFSYLKFSLHFFYISSITFQHFYSLPTYNTFSTMYETYNEYFFPAFKTANQYRSFLLNIKHSSKTLLASLFINLLTLRSRDNINKKNNNSIPNITSS